MCFMRPSDTAKSIAFAQLVSDTWLELELTNHNAALSTSLAGAMNAWGDA